MSEVSSASGIFTVVTGVKFLFVVSALGGR